MDPLTNRQMGAHSGHVRRVHGPAPKADPFAQADQANREHQARADLANHQARKTARRDNQPPPAGGLFDECRRGEQDLWS